LTHESGGSYDVEVFVRNRNVFRTEITRKKLVAKRGRNMLNDFSVARAVTGNQIVGSRGSWIILEASRENVKSV
jgi:hypothetical protein